MGELVKRLHRYSENCVAYKLDADFASAVQEAADAIEELDFDCNRYEKDYKALCAYLPKWIPMTEAMPESGVCVLVTDGLEVGEGWLTEITNTQGHFMRWCVPMTDIDVDRRPITHWMPMPKAPRDGE